MQTCRTFGIKNRSALGVTAPKTREGLKIVGSSRESLTDHSQMLPRPSADPNGVYYGRVIAWREGLRKSEAWGHMARFNGCSPLRGAENVVNAGSDTASLKPSQVGSHLVNTETLNTNPGIAPVTRSVGSRKARLYGSQSTDSLLATGNGGSYGRRV